MMVASLRIWPSLLLCMALSACALSSTPRSDAHFGQSLRALRAQQTLNPQGSPHQADTPMVSGAVAAQAQENYRQSFAPVQRGSAGDNQVREQMK